MPSSSGRGAAVWLNLGIVYVVWGSTYFGIKVAVDTKYLPKLPREDIIITPQ